MKNLVIISLDCVRREALSCYNLQFSSYLHKKIPALRLRGMNRLKRVYEPAVNSFLKCMIAPETPNIDSLSSDGVIFSEAVSQAPYTPASHASIFTGLNPFSHGIRQFVGYRLSSAALTLAEKLKLYGAETGGFVGANALGDFYGLQRGFDVYDFHPSESLCSVGSLKIYRRDHVEVTENALKWLSGVQGMFFLFVHYFDVHETQESAFSYQPLFQIVKMKQVDRSIGRIIQLLRERQLYEDTVFVVVSDHGNDFGVNEPGHREYLYDSTLLVPLIIKGDAAMKGLRERRQVRLIDIFPTVMELLNVPEDHPAGYSKVEGVSMRPMLEDDRVEALPAYSETYIELSNEQWATPKGSFMSLRYPDWKLIVDRITGQAQLFNLKEDPGERNDIFIKNKDKGGALKQELSQLLAGAEEVTDVMSQEEIGLLKDSLKGLGYLD